MKTILFALLFTLCGLAQAGPASVQGLRLSASADGGTLTVDLSAPARHRLLRLRDPERLVLDLEGARLADSEFVADIQGGPVRGLRSAPRGDGVRVVLDLNAPVSYSERLAVAGEGRRLVLELKGEGSAKAAPAAGLSTPSAAVAKQTFGRMEDLVITPAAPKLRDLVVAIDAGHGGKDPGAIGPRGTREKEVVLAIARRLEKLIDREPGMHARLVRADDRYIKLRERIKIASEFKADLFISIHADSFRDFGASGASVFILSPKGASSEAARLLAESENAADFIGGVGLESRDEMVASVLLDMSQTKTIEESGVVAGAVLKRLKGLGKVHSRSVQRAGFAVLKSPDIPSMLVETGFLSNPMEERKLRDPAHQQRLAAAILGGVRAYFEKHAPAGTWIAEGKRPPEPARRAESNTVRVASTTIAPRRHTIRRGETLYAIARQYGVDVAALRVVNGLKGNEIVVGKRLLIPAVREGA